MKSQNISLHLIIKIYAHKYTNLTSKRLQCLGHPTRPPDHGRPDRLSKLVHIGPNQFQFVLMVRTKCVRSMVRIHGSVECPFLSGTWSWFPVPNSRPVRSPDLRSVNNLQNKSIGEFRNFVLIVKNMKKSGLDWMKSNRLDDSWFIILSESTG